MNMLWFFGGLLNSETAEKTWKTTNTLVGQKRVAQWSKSARNVQIRPLCVYLVEELTCIPKSIAHRNIIDDWVNESFVSDSFRTRFLSTKIRRVEYTKGIVFLDYSPYSPDWTPSNFWQFPKLKFDKRKRFWQDH